MDGNILEVLIFEMDGERHGLPVADVQELLPALTIMPVPGAPPNIEGVINLRGVVVPVVDVRRRFGLPARPLAPSDHFIVIKASDRLMALHVDRALELAHVGALAAAGDAAEPRVAKWGDQMVL